jgi:hypothetical protein
MGACARSCGEGRPCVLAGGLVRRGCPASANLRSARPRPCGTGSIRPNLRGQSPSRQGVRKELERSVRTASGTLSQEIQADSEFFFCFFLFLKTPSGSGDGKRLTMYGEAARTLSVSHRPNRNPARQGRTASRPCLPRTSELRPREAAMGFLRPSALRPRWQAPPEGPPVGPPEAFFRPV